MGHDHVRIGGRGRVTEAGLIVGDVHYIHRHGRKIEVKTLYTGPAPAKKRREQFTLVPVPLMLKLATLSLNARWLAVVLLWKSFQQRGRPFTCADLKEFGIKRYKKSSGLIELEQAGIITVDRARCRSPRIKILI